MNRRTILTAICSGAIASMAGCQSPFQQTGPVDFGLLNFTEDAHEAGVTILTGDGGIVLEEDYEIDGVGPNQSSVAIEEEGFTEAANGDELTISVTQQDGQMKHYHYQVSCINNDEIQDVVFAEIRPEGDSSALHFRNSSCSE